MGFRKSYPKTRAGIEAEIGVLEGRLVVLKAELKIAVQADIDASIRDLKAGVGPLGPEYVALQKQEEALLAKVNEIDEDRAKYERGEMTIEELAAKYPQQS